MTPRTFPALLADQVRRDGARPLVTFYDDATGERVELSVVTFANWVAKTAGLLQDELDLERGGRVLVDLPTHWLGPVLLGAAWSVGGAVMPPVAGGSPDLVVCGPGTLDHHAAGAAPVVALSLLPMGARFTTPLPAGVVDFGAVVWGQPDAFLPLDPPGPEDLAWDGGPGAPGVTQERLLAEAAEHLPTGAAAGGSRLLTELNPCSRAGLVTLTAPLLAGGGSVWVRHPDPDGWERRAAAEHATRLVEGQDPRS